MEYRFGTTDDWSVDRLAAIAVDGDGRLAHLTFFDHADRTGAEVFLDELASRVNPPSQDAIAETSPVPNPMQRRIRAMDRLLAAWGLGGRPGVDGPGLPPDTPTFRTAAARTP